MQYTNRYVHACRLMQMPVAAMKKHLIERAKMKIERAGKSMIHKEIPGKRQAEHKAVCAAHNKAMYAKCNVYDRMAGCC